MQVGQVVGAADQARLGERAQAHLLHEVLGVDAVAAQREGGAVQAVDVAREGRGVEQARRGRVRLRSGAGARGGAPRRRGAGGARRLRCAGGRRAAADTASSAPAAGGVSGWRAAASGAAARGGRRRGAASAGAASGGGARGGGERDAVSVAAAAGGAGGRRAGMTGVGMVSTLAPGPPPQPPGESPDLDPGGRGCERTSRTHSREWPGESRVLTAMRTRPWSTTGQSPWVLFVEAFLVVNAVAAVISLTLAPGSERWFTWTIVPDASARLLAVMYANAVVLGVLALRQPDWAHARVVFVLITTFALAATVMTLLQPRPVPGAPLVPPRLLARRLRACSSLTAPPVLVWQERLHGGRLPVDVPLTA